MSHTPRAPRAVQQRQAIGRRFRAYRLALGLTARDVAAHIGASRTAMTSIDTGCADVNTGTLIDAAAAVGLEVALVGEYHLPLLNLTADEIEAIRIALGQRPINAPHVSSALDKLTTTEETPRRPTVPEIRRFDWYKLPPEQREQMLKLVRSLGLDPDYIAVDFTLVRYGPGPWQLHLTEFERNENGVKFAGPDGDVASRTVVRQIDPPAFLLTTTEETPDA